MMLIDTDVNIEEIQAKFHTCGNSNTPATKSRYNIIPMEILIYQRQKVDYGEEDDTTWLVRQFRYY